MLHCRPAFHGCTELQLQIRIRGGAHAPVLPLAPASLTMCCRTAVSAPIQVYSLPTQQVRVGTSKGARAILKALLTPKVEHRLTALELAQRHAGWIGR